MNNPILRILFVITLASPLAQAQQAVVETFQMHASLHLQSLSNIHDRITKRTSNLKESTGRDLAICLEIGQSNESLHNLLDQAHAYAEPKQDLQLHDQVWELDKELVSNYVFFESAYCDSSLGDGKSYKSLPLLQKSLDEATSLITRLQALIK
jgi:hypothetical protein